MASTLPPTFINPKRKKNIVVATNLSITILYVWKDFSFIDSSIEFKSNSNSNSNAKILSYRITFKFMTYYFFICVKLWCTKMRNNKYKGLGKWHALWRNFWLSISKIEIESNTSTFLDPSNTWIYILETTSFGMVTHEKRSLSFLFFLIHRYILH